MKKKLIKSVYCNSYKFVINYFIVSATHSITATASSFIYSNVFEYISMTARFCLDDSIASSLDRFIKGKNEK